MVSKLKKKYTSGEGAQFISRKAALKKLQLTLKDFRKLCILKGIYPREPRNRRRAQKGTPGIKILYHIKDVQFLMHEPIIWKLREYKIFGRKVGRAKALKDFDSLRKYLDKHPTLKLDHIVKERYPTFIDALNDLDDCLTLCYLFSTFPSLKHIPRDQSALCRRLTIEFLHAIIEAKALRKVFISIKGYYYQAEIKGQTITWIVPHHFSFEPQMKSEVDFKIMSTFVEFYTVLLGFVNFRLYHSLNLYYPPKFSALDESVEEDKSLVDETVFVSERVAALNFPLLKMVSGGEEEEEIDSFEMEGTSEEVEKARKEYEKIKALKVLFKGLKFFLNREVPREPLVFIIRCFSGEVSWDKNMFVGATYVETDETITHHIVDRPSTDKQYMSRYYVQPQWVFDCINARTLLPESKYLMDATLPPHLSPFVDKDRTEEYIPPEERELYDQSLLEQMRKQESEDESLSEKEDDDPESNSNMDAYKSESTVMKKNEVEEVNMNEELDTKKPKLSVTPGQECKEVPWEKSKQERQEYRLREKMIKRKHRNLYKSMMSAKKDRKKEIWLLRKKRRLIEESSNEGKKTTPKKKLKVPKVQ